MVQSYAAVAIGAVGAWVYLGASALLVRLRVDDPLGAAPVHFFCGMWGVLAVGFFATEVGLCGGGGRRGGCSLSLALLLPRALTAAPAVQTGVKAAYGYANDWGVFYGGDGKQLGMQLLGLACIAAWTCLISTLLFGALKWVRARAGCLAGSWGRWVGVRGRAGRPAASSLRVAARCRCHPGSHGGGLRAQLIHASRQWHSPPPTLTPTRPPAPGPARPQVGWLRVSEEDERRGLDLAQSIGAGVVGLNFACFKGKSTDEDEGFAPTPLQ